MVEAPASYALAGRGGVGSRFEEVATKPHIALRHGLEPRPAYVLGKDGWHEGGSHGPLSEIPPDEMPEVDALFIATAPTEDDQPMLSLTEQQLAKGGIAVTAEKGVPADHLQRLDKLPGKYGVWAAAGGGARIVPVLPYYTIDPRNIRELYKGMNGTLAYTFDRLAKGDDLDRVMADADEARMIEPIGEGASYHDVIRTEARDAAVKEVIMSKLTLPGFNGMIRKHITTKLTDREIDQAVDRPDLYRYLTAVFPEGAEEQARAIEARRLGGFNVRYAGHIMIGGFIDVASDENPALMEFLGVEGATAAYSINLGPGDGSTKDGYYFGKGDGAGPDPTTTAMLDNYEFLRQEAAREAVLEAHVRAQVLTEIYDRNRHFTAN